MLSAFIHHKVIINANKKRDNNDKINLCNQIILYIYY